MKIMIGGRCVYNENTGRWRGLNDTGYADADLLNTLGVRQIRPGRFVQFFREFWERNPSFEYSLLDYIDWFDNDITVLHLLGNIVQVRWYDADFHGGMDRNHEAIYEGVTQLMDFINTRVNQRRRWGYGIKKKTRRHKTSRNRKPRKSKKSNKPRKSTRKR